MPDNTQTIGQYRVLYPIGKGGMAEVFAVEKSGPAGFNKKLCLKRIRREYAEDAGFIKSFESEARIVSQLQHTNIVQVFDFFQEADDLCLVMELIDGLSLHEMMRLINRFGLLLPLDIALYILESLLLALQHAHSLTLNGKTVPVIHRDISPPNLLISTDGVVKLVDFGIAKAQGLSPQTTNGGLKGKLCYMAPERLKGDARPLGPESDLFSAGVVFWEMLAKERLFKATMDNKIFHKVVNFESAAIDHLHPRINRFLESILAPNPEHRFQSAKETVTDLKRLGVRPCDQAEVARVVTELKLLKELYSAHRKAQKAANQQRVIGGPSDKWEDSVVPASRKKRPFLSVAALIVAILAGAVGWRMLRNETYTVLETDITVPTDEPEYMPRGESDRNTQRLLVAPTVAPSLPKKAVSPPDEEPEKAPPIETPILTDDYAKSGDEEVREVRPNWRKRQKKKRIEKEDSKKDNTKNRSFVPFVNQKKENDRERKD